MADGLDLLSAMFAQDYRPIEDPYGIAAQGVASALPYAVNPYGSTAGNFATVLGGALVSGLLGYQARKRTDERNVLQSRALMEALTQGVTPERRQELIEQSPRLAKPLAMLELQSAQRAREQAAAEQKMMQEYKYKSALQKQEDLGIPFTEALAIEEGQPATQPTDVGFLGTKAENTIDAKRKNFQSKPIYNSVAISEETIKRLAPAVFNQQAMTSRDFVVGAVQIIEPGMAVREGDEQAVKAAAGALNLAQNKIRNVFDNKGELSLKDRAQIMDIVERAYNGRLETFNKQVDASIMDAAKSINRTDEKVIADLRSRFKGGLGDESYDAIVNRLATVPGAKAPEGFDFAEQVRQIARREISGEDVIANLKAKFDVEQTTQQQQQAQPAQPVREPAFYEKAIDKIQEDPTMVGQLDTNERRIRTLMSKGEANWTPQEKAEVVALLKFFGVK
jgi:hypothetical protein